MSNSISILFALDLGATIFQVNLINTMRSTMSILLLIPFGILSDRYGRKSARISALFLFSIIGMVLGPSLATFILLLSQITLRSMYQITAIVQIGVMIYLAIIIARAMPLCVQYYLENLLVLLNI